MTKNENDSDMKGFFILIWAMILIIGAGIFLSTFKKQSYSNFCENKLNKYEGYKTHYKIDDTETGYVKCVEHNVSKIYKYDYKIIKGVI